MTSMETYILRCRGIWAAILIAVVASGCRKELCFDHDEHALLCRVDIKPAWEHEWERDYGCGWIHNWESGKLGYDYDDLRPEPSAGLAVFVYDEMPSGDAEMSKEYHISPEGEVIRLNEGKHRVIAYNDDTRNIIIDDMAYLPTARATTRSKSRASYMQLHDDEHTVGAPDMLYGHYEADYVTALSTVAQPLELTMRPLVYKYLVRYEVEQGMEYVVQARGALAGMAESVYLTDGHTDDKAATVLFDCELKPFGVEARVLSFGVPGFPDKYYNRAGNGDAKSRYALNLELLLSTGSSFSLDFDVTDQIDRQPRGGVITVDGIVISSSGEPSGSAFDVNVSEWGEYEEIPLN